MNDETPEKGRQIEDDLQKREFTAYNADLKETPIVDIEDAKVYEIPTPLSVEEIFQPRRFIVVVPTKKAKDAVSIEVISVDECQKLGDAPPVDFILYDERLNYLMPTFGHMVSHDWTKIVSFKLKDEEIS